MDKPPKRFKRKRDDDEDDQKSAAKTKKNVAKDDYYTEESEEQNNKENEQEMIKKYTPIKQMFVKHSKSTFDPQDDDEEPHPCIAHMYALHITESLNVLQAMEKHQ